MLKKACSYNATVNQYCALYLSHANTSIGEKDWQLLEIMKEFVEVFHNATLFFSRIYSPTSSQALNHFYEISIASDKYSKLSKICV